MIKHLFSQVDAAILIYFRFFAGMLLSFELINSLVLGDFYEYLSPIHFSYYFFSWIKPWSYWPMVALYALTIFSGFTLALGIYQRLSALLLFIGYTLFFLMEKTEYNNHLYLYCLISFWMIWIPRTNNCRWFYYLLLFHISVVYFFAGLAKLDPEWLSGQTVKTMLSNAKYPDFYIYGGLLFDLLIVPLLLWRRSRIPAFIAACMFHIMNAVNFGLATFPWFSIMMTAMFFGTRWPRRFGWFNGFFSQDERQRQEIKFSHYLLVGVLGIYCFLHLIIPLRHLLYTGKPSWTEEGHLFSWRMKLRNKTGDTFFYVVDQKNKHMRIISPRDFLTKKQFKNMTGHPDSILQFAHYLRDKNPGSAVYASSRVSLNGRIKKEMINTQVNLAKEERKLGAYSWVISENPVIHFRRRK